MSRGVVLWPDVETSAAIREFWGALVDAGLPSCATHTHRLHQPHVSLSVADELPVQATLDAVGTVPRQRIPLPLESIGLFPEGVLILPLVPSQELLLEKRRVHELVEPLGIGTWPFFAEGGWMPHVTCGWGLSENQFARAAALAKKWLPIRGWLDHGGVEDGTTGENWPVP